MLKKLAISGMIIFSMMTTQVISFAGDILGNNTFDNNVGLPWHVVETMPAKTSFQIKDGKYYVTVINPGAPSQMWDVQFRHRGIKICKNHVYTVKFTVKADKNAQVYPKIGDSKDPYYEDWNYNQRSWMPIKLQANVPTKVSETFTAQRDGYMCEFAFYIGGRGVPAGTTFEFDDIYLDDAQVTPPPPIQTPAPKDIRVNQLGYYPGYEKKATLITVSTTPLDWVLKDISKNEVLSGETQVFGADKDSGDFVHIIDFSNFKNEGKGYTLEVGTAESHPFDISGDIYSTLRYDALKYFYHQRSGNPIESRYTQPANGAPNDPKWHRPAGHKPDLVPTEPYAGQSPSWAYTHSHTLDVTGGWYDAGDHGKYLIGGGLAVWAMQNQFERAKMKGTDAQYGDGKLNIPESGNGYPDLLDEVRWNLECLLKMQIPEGMPKAGMVHYKAQDETWTGLGIAPHEDTKMRVLKPPTTGATLNLAAIAAQGSRLWKEYDPKFAETCLSQAEIAWDAAVANPSIFHPSDEAYGGCAYYETDYVKDEFYWAACELYITTGKAKYLEAMKENTRHYLEMPKEISSGEAFGLTGSFNSENTSGLGTISLLINKPAGIDMDTIKTNMMAAGDNYLGIQDKQGYGIPIDQGPVEVQRDAAGNPIPSTEKIGYPWASNSYVINSCIVMAYAYEISNDTRYLDGVLEAMDYIMGRNPNTKSYVSGYGENSLVNPHHRYFAYQANPDYPQPPPGLLSGGPNSGLEDPWVRGSGWQPYQFPPQKCYMDHIESWSTNETATHWNAPLAWVTAFMNDTAKTLPSPSGYTVSGYVKPDFAISETVQEAILSGFNVEVVGKGLSAKTNGKGYFEIKNVPASTGYVIKVSKPGYLNREVRNVKVDADRVIASETNPIVVYIGDMNGDQVINMADIMELAKVFNSVAGDGRYNRSADINEDGAVNMADVMIVAKHFNATSNDY